ncbi:hypothetical protein [Thiothrix winogradskyi]|uniref:Uncharacterized protein n=1 Tax=Thiothrix winogradskyi TaxID=96472 RepID=A0ABY3T4I0_9GAMM|nr:hypothetical protein [Thiothrix winogradskyi]UJS26290.1 hypothetical protein L2Y54_09685 [Thiothrix winogradskyi]
MGLFSAIGTIAGAAFGAPTLGAAAGGIVDGLSANSTAKKASAAQNAMMAEQTRLYGQQADMGQHFFDQYKDNYEPLALSQLRAAQTGVDPNYYAGLADSGVVQNQGLALQSAQRNLERNGVAPTDGRWLAMQNQNALALSGSRAAAQNQARQGALELNWNRRNQQVDYGAGLVNRGSGMMADAASGFDGMGRAYGAQASGAASTAGYEFGTIAGNLVDAYRKPDTVATANVPQANPYTTEWGTLKSAWNNGGFGGR